ncbi:glycosyl hydrolase family 8 [Acuticoccus mangrovi]|uniref:cellulase n=1 Tax=Acuticoccus mangrovi TaxID=2796142 RepID=A0A934IPW6_9HYPH|nr:glycosyl hydrolase family 8 [Acuticoccus mangrovi]MBJ3776137.1 hypothetical protein [Acuticoccus mangrovi]
MIVVMNVSALAEDSADSFKPYLGELDPQTQYWFSSAFTIYKKTFIKPSGRVFDPQNGGITHSESQGYGMMLALLGNDQAAFDLIWNFTKSEMQRADGLISWKFVPGRGITDRNNATDGELFIGMALALATVKWGNQSYLLEARRIANAVGKKLILNYGGYTLLLPGEWARPSRNSPYAIVNMSYFIPLALQIYEGLAPDYPWDEVYRDSFRILDDMIHPPSDWTAINEYGEPEPARGFPRKFSYDAVRIPMYLLQAGLMHKKTAQVLNEIWGNPINGPTFSFNVMTMGKTDRFWGNSYELMHDILGCMSSNKTASFKSLEMKMKNYFDTSLHLMMIAALYANYPRCFPQPACTHC